MRNKSYNFVCNNCGKKEIIFEKLKIKAEQKYRHGGGVITSNGKEYCSKKCYYKKEYNYEQ